MRKRLKGLLLTLLMAIALVVAAPSVLPSGIGAEVVEAATVKISATKATLIKGQTKTLKMKGTSGKVKWSSSKKSVAAVNSKGKVTAKKKGTATITAKVGNKKYTCKVKVETPKISEKSVVLIKGQTDTLKMTGTTQTVKWSSSKKSVATVNSKGKVTAKKKGTAKITAKVGGKKYTCKVEVEKPSIESTSISIREGKTETLSMYDTSQTVTWKSSNTSVATVTKKGETTTVTGKKIGSATVTATVLGKNYKCKVSVVEMVINPSEKAALGVIRLKEMLKDPSSLVINDICIHYEDQTYGDTTYSNIQTICIDYNANNSYGVSVRGYATVSIYPLDSVPYDYIWHKDLGDDNYLSISTYSYAYWTEDTTYSLVQSTVMRLVDEYTAEGKYKIKRTFC